ncbi:MAG: CoB--CoM heterodisulfide reductase iron-sulfur subunit A family protein [Candidatus Syntropharchaeia archaeon]
MGEEIRIGVFVCHCGMNIGGVIDVPRVVEYAKTLPNVAYAESNLYTCAEDGLNSIKNAITEHRLNRVVVASCTPRTHAPLFQRTCEEAGLNKYLFEFANIREQCSWVHMKEPEKATKKTCDLIRMAVAKAELLEPQEDVKVDVEPSALIIGGGISGMTAALNLASQGFEVYLVEKEKEIGGYLRKIDRMYQGKSADEVIEPLIEKVKSNRNIVVMTESTVKSVDGYIGNYEVVISKKDGETSMRLIGTIIVATGATEYIPDGLYGYGEYEGVLTLTDFEKMCKEKGVPNIDSIVFIQCVGSRGQDKSYCSRICCTTGIKNALRIKEINKKAKVTIFYREITTYGIKNEMLYNRAREEGIRFIRFSLENPPKVSREGGRLVVSYHHQTLGVKGRIDADIIVLATPLVPRPDAEELSKILKVPLDPNGFFLEAHVKLRPVDFAKDGIFLCGTAHSPKDASESVRQALGAASRASIPLSRGSVIAEAITSVVSEEKCIGCGRCVELCPYGAIELREKSLILEEIELTTRKALIHSTLCKGCGTCTAECPSGAITTSCFTSQQIEAVIKEAVEVI